MYIGAGTRHTGLSTSGKNACQQAINRRFYIGIVKHNLWRLAAQFQNGRNQILRRGRSYMTSRRATTGKGDFIKVGMATKLCTHFDATRYNI